MYLLPCHILNIYIYIYIYIYILYIYKTSPTKAERVCIRVCCNKVPKDHTNCQHHKAADHSVFSSVSRFCFALMTTITYQIYNVSHSVDLSGYYCTTVPRKQGDSPAIRGRIRYGMIRRTHSTTGGRPRVNSLLSTQAGNCVFVLRVAQPQSVRVSVFKSNIQQNNGLGKYKLIQTEVSAKYIVQYIYI